MTKTFTEIEDVLFFFSLRNKVECDLVITSSPYKGYFRSVFGKWSFEQLEGFLLLQETGG